MSPLAQKKVAHLKRKVRVRKKITGTTARPRLNIYRSTKHIYAQIIDDSTGTTLASASTLLKDVAEGLSSTGNLDAAKKVGAAIAKAALAKGVTTVVFDRNGFLYHGRVKELADAARENGLTF